MDSSLLRTVRLFPECQKSYITYLYNTDTSVKPLYLYHVMFIIKDGSNYQGGVCVVDITSFSN